MKNYSKVIVLLVILLNVGFTAGVFYVSLRMATIPDSLIVAWFSFTTGQLWFMAQIKKAKIRRLSKDDVQRDGESN